MRDLALMVATLSLVLLSGAAFFERRTFDNSDESAAHPHESRKRGRGWRGARGELGIGVGQLPTIDVARRRVVERLPGRRRVTRLSWKRFRMCSRLTAITLGSNVRSK